MSYMLQLSYIFHITDKVTITITSIIHQSSLKIHRPNLEQMRQATPLFKNKLKLLYKYNLRQSNISMDNFTQKFRSYTTVTDGTYYEN